MHSVYQRTRCSEAFSEALPYTVLTKAVPSSSIAQSPKVHSCTNIRPASTVFQSPNISSFPIASSPTHLSSTSVTSSPAEHRSRTVSASSAAYRSSTISGATISRLQQPDPVEHQDVRTFLQKLLKREVEFWDPNVQHPVTTEHAHLLSAPANYGVYLCYILEDTGVHHKILRRFARVALYRWSLRGYTAEHLAQVLEGVAYFSNKGDPRKDIETYISAGSRYAYLAQKLGGLAALFFLPQNFGDSL